MSLRGQNPHPSLRHLGAPVGPAGLGLRERANPRNPILTDNAAFAGPGHHALITDDAGQLWVLYHAVAQADGRRAPVPVGDGCTTAGLPGLPRRLLLDPVTTRPDGWSEINGGTGPSSALMPAPVVITHGR